MRHIYVKPAYVHTVIRDGNGTIAVSIKFCTPGSEPILYISFILQREIVMATGAMYAARLLVADM